MAEQVLLRLAVKNAIMQYLERLDGEQATGLYDMTLDIVEDELLKCVMLHVNGNQTRATKVLTMSRATLRKKLQERDILHFGKQGQK